MPPWVDYVHSYQLFVPKEHAVQPVSYIVTSTDGTENLGKVVYFDSHSGLVTFVPGELAITPEQVNSWTYLSPTPSEVEEIEEPAKEIEEPAKETSNLPEPQTPPKLERESPRRVYLGQRRVELEFE